MSAGDRSYVLRQRSARMLRAGLGSQTSARHPAVEPIPTLACGVPSASCLLGYWFLKLRIGCVFRWLIPANVVFALRGFLVLVINYCSLRGLASMEILLNKKRAVKSDLIL